LDNRAGINLYERRIQPALARGVHISAASLMEVISMYKTCVLFALFVGVSANATSLIYGPYAVKSLGERGKDAQWATCTIRLNSVVYENSKGEKSTAQAPINQKEFEKAIRAAASDKLATGGLHMTVTIPTESITAGVFPQLENFVLYKDSSSIQDRQGKDAQDLIKQVNALCKNLKPVK
jgi:hypothetical protein